MKRVFFFFVVQVKTSIVHSFNLSFSLLFSLPAENDPEDEYNRAAKATDDECETIYSKQCRFSIIGFLMSKDRPIL